MHAAAPWRQRHDPVELLFSDCGRRSILGISSELGYTLLCFLEGLCVVGAYIPSSTCRHHDYLVLRVNLDCVEKELLPGCQRGGNSRNGQSLSGMCIQIMAWRNPKSNPTTVLLNNIGSVTSYIGWRLSCQDQACVARSPLFSGMRHTRQELGRTLRIITDGKPVGERATQAMAMHRILAQGFILFGGRAGIFVES
jgi:hypothetical protein